MMKPFFIVPWNGLRRVNQTLRGTWTWLGLLAVLLAVGLVGRAAPAAAQAQDPIPALAYYYIWFDPGSWERAKTDFPQLGRYSSDDREVMRQHIRWAKDAGLDGFIVSWKSTEPLNRRLDQLVELAGQEEFKLVVIYQGLDFERDPLPVERIADDLDYFIGRYAGEPVFDPFGKPAVIWSGSWEFSVEEIASVTETRRDDLLILASERNVDGYRRLSGLVDGDAYYWSSVNPDTFPGYERKLADMGAAVHADGGLWIAPSAPGFDARLIGGIRVVERQGGETLRRQIRAAFDSAPDALGLISWNEFSENTHLEPSINYGTQYLELLADMLGGVPPEPLQFDSEEPFNPGAIAAAPNPQLGGGRVLSLLVLAGVVFVSLVVIVFRTDSQG